MTMSQEVKIDDLGHQTGDEEILSETGPGTDADEGDADQVKETRSKARPTKRRRKKKKKDTSSPSAGARGTGAGAGASARLEEIQRERDELRRELEEIRSREVDFKETVTSEVSKLRSELDRTRNELTFERHDVSDPELREFLAVKWRREQDTYEDAADTLDEFIQEYSQREGNLLSRVQRQDSADSGYDDYGSQTRQRGSRRTGPVDATSRGTRRSNVTQGASDPNSILKMSAEEYQKNKDKIFAELFGS